MVRTTIMLPAKLKSRAESLAKRRRISLAELIRESLESQLAGQRNGRKRDPLFADTFTFVDDRPPDVAANLDKYLDQIAEEEMRRWSPK